MMKKFSITAFAVFYAALLVFVSAERAGEWAVKEADTLTHHQIVHGSKSFGKAGKSDSHLLQTRLHESGFVMELPREAGGAPVPYQRHTNLPQADRYISAFSRLISSRAPPVLA
jgi:hypothetical protein